MKLAALTIAAAILGGCAATQDSLNGWAITLHADDEEPGGACLELESAEKNEAMRTDKNANAYEAALVMQLPNCWVESKVGEELWVYGRDPSGRFASVLSPQSNHGGFGHYYSRYRTQRLD